MLSYGVNGYRSLSCARRQDYDVIEAAQDILTYLHLVVSQVKHAIIILVLCNRKNVFEYSLMADRSTAQDYKNVSKVRKSTRLLITSCTKKTLEGSIKTLIVIE